MKIRLPEVFILLFIFSLSSCDRDECNCPTDMHNKWEATDFMSIESVLYAKENDYNPVLEFKYDGTISFQLDKNSGTGTFEITKNNELEIANLGWTDMCCDSDFSEKFAEMLPQVTSYQIEDNNLRLNIADWGFIKLQQISE